MISRGFIVVLYNRNVVCLMAFPEFAMGKKVS